MCGIAGILSQNPSWVTAQRILQMTGALAHRGPDGEGYWIDETQTAALGHRRLSILDLSLAGNQPMHCLQRYRIIHNGEIYNYVELRETLQKKGYTFFTQTDTEVIAAAFDCWEEECPVYFDGMFAFAIWDEKTKTLFAARDRFGEKPFYYFFNESRFLFASEMKALWAADINRIPNRKMLFNYISIGYTANPQNPEETFFENIYKLPPACWLTYHAATQQLETEKYWQLSVDEDKQISDQDAREKFISLFHTSVSRRLRSDVDVGISLSGGLDSSSLVAMLSSIQHPTANKSHWSRTAFTASFPEFQKDETVYARKVAKEFNLKQSIIPVSELDLIRDWDSICYHQEEPVSSSSVIAQYQVYKQAAQQGIKVLLDGQGADEILAGYHHFFKWYWQELFLKRKLLRSREINAARKNGVRETFGIKNIIAALFPDYATVFLEKQYLLQALRHKDLTKDFIRQQSRTLFYTAPEDFSLNGMLYFHTIEHGLEELLRYADRNAMAFGRETRLPFLSHELVEFLFTLPAHFKIRNGWTKWLLRDSMKQWLPQEIVWRRDKTGFEPPQQSWMQDKLVQQLISEAKQKLIDEKILKPEVLHKKILALPAYDASNYDWRYLSASFLFK